MELSKRGAAGSKIEEILALSKNIGKIEHACSGV